MDLRPIDLEMQMLPGAGVRLIHKLSGATVECSTAECSTADSRLQNQEAAMELLKNELFAKGYIDQL